MARAVAAVFLLSRWGNRCVINVKCALVSICVPFWAAWFQTRSPKLRESQGNNKQPTGKQRLPRRTFQVITTTLRFYSKVLNTVCMVCTRCRKLQLHREILQILLTARSQSESIANTPQSESSVWNNCHMPCDGCTDRQFSSHYAELHSVTVRRVSRCVCPSLCSCCQTSLSCSLLPLQLCQLSLHSLTLTSANLAGWVSISLRLKKNHIEPINRFVFCERLMQKQS